MMVRDCRADFGVIYELSAERRLFILKLNLYKLSFSAQNVKIRVISFLQEVSVSVSLFPLFLPNPDDDMDGEDQISVS